MNSSRLYIMQDFTYKINYFYNLQDTVFYTKEAGATTRWVESVPPKLFRFVNV